MALRLDRQAADAIPALQVGAAVEIHSLQRSRSPELNGVRVSVVAGFAPAAASRGSFCIIPVIPFLVAYISHSCLREFSPNKTMAFLLHFVQATLCVEGASLEGGRDKHLCRAFVFVC